jgi:hypothetical protein
VVPFPEATLPATYPTVMTASYFAELCDVLTEPAHPVPEIYLLMRRAWGYLRERKPDRRGVEHFETELAKVMGVHDPSRPAHRSLASVLHHLPESREKLLKELGE